MTNISFLGGIPLFEYLTNYPRIASYARIARSSDLVVSLSSYPLFIEESLPFFLSPFHIDVGVMLLFLGFVCIH